jgi:hypothetical protein
MEPCPAGEAIAQAYGRQKRWGGLVKGAGLAGAFGTDNEVRIRLRTKSHRLPPDSRARPGAIGHATRDDQGQLLLSIAVAAPIRERAIADTSSCGSLTLLGTCRRILV